jgi:hypothetical protein
LFAGLAKEVLKYLPPSIVINALAKRYQSFTFPCLLFRLPNHQRKWLPLCLTSFLKLQVKGLLKDKKLEMLVDADLQGIYTDDEVEQLIQVALLCTQSSPMERPKMSEVVRMLEGDGLAERWEEWQKEEVFRQEFNHTHHAHTNWIVDSSSHIPPDELSGPR